MSKWRTITILFAIAASVAIGVTPSILQFLAEHQLIRLQQSGVKVQADGVSGFLFGVSAKSIEGWVTIPQQGPRLAGLPVQLRAESVQVSAGIRSILPQTFVHLTGAFYGGTLDTSVSRLVTRPTFSGTVHGVDVSLHPQLRALGFEQGLVDLAALEHPVSGTWTNTSNYTLKIRELVLRPPPTIANVTRITELRDGTVELSASVNQDGALTTESCTFDSSLASGTFSATATLRSPSDITNISGSLQVNLDRQDSDKLAPWLPILTNQAVSSESVRFVCHFRSTACSSSGALRLGSGCIRASCS
jgi:hypothetical protein